MTSTEINHDLLVCPAEDILKILSGKWRPQIIRLAMDGSVRFSQLLKQLPEANKQSLSIALRELESAQLLSKTIVREKPLHIEYSLTEKGYSVTSIYRLASALAHS